MKNASILGKKNIIFKIVVQESGKKSLKMKKLSKKVNKLD